MAQNWLQNIEVGPVKITGGSALIVIGLFVWFGLDWALSVVGQPPAADWLKIAIAVVLVGAGIWWFFRPKPKN